MAHPIPIGNRVFLFLVFVIPSIQIGYSQTAGPFGTCAVSAVPRQVRAEGVTEPLGNIILQCSGTANSTFTGNYNVLLPIDVTNRVNSTGGTTDAVIAVDYGAGATPVPGVLGQISGHNITFNGVSITVPASGTFIIQISNIRADISELGGDAGQPVIAGLSVPLNLDHAQVTVASVATALYATVHENGIACTGSPSPASFDLASFFTAGTAFFSTRVTEGFGTAFTVRAAGEDSGTRFLVQYSGFPAKAQLYVPNLVAGYDAKTPTAGGDLGLAPSGGQYVPGSGTLLLALVSGADTNGAGGTPFATPTGSSPVTLNSASQVPLMNGAGYAVYEVVDANPAVVESAQFPTFVVLTQITGTAVAQESLSLAPVSQTPTASVTDPVPRFIATNPATDCGIVGDCQAGYFPKLSVAPIPIQLTAGTDGKETSAPGYVYVQNTGGGVMNWSATPNYVNGSGWLSFDQSMHENSATLRVDAQAAGLATGVYRANVIVDAGPLAGNYSVPVTLTVQGPQLQPPSSATTITAVLNPATLTPTPLVGGSLGLITGTNLAGKNVSVAFNSIPATLLYTSSNEIYFQVPPAIVIVPFALLVLTVDGTSTAPLPVNIAPAWPSIFAHAVRNQDYSENTASNPAAGGSTLQVFLTGIPSNVTVTAQVQNRSGLTPSFAGPAPGETGVQQVNLTLPADLPKGTTQLEVCASASGQQYCSAGYPVTIK